MKEFRVKVSEEMELADYIPNSQLYIVPGESHGSYIVHNEKLGHLILGWEP